MQVPADHVLHGVSRRMEHVVQDGCELRARLQSQEARFVALRQQLQEQRPQEEGGDWEHEVAEIREGLDELQALRREHGRTTASMAGHVQQLAGRLYIGRGHGGGSPLRTATSASMGGQAAGDLAQRVGHLEESVRQLSEWASRFLDGSQCRVEEVVVHEAAAEKEGNRIREAIAALASRFDAEYAVAIGKVGQVAKEAATARQTCESLHGVCSKMKAEVTQSVQELFGDLWRSYSSGLNSKLADTREELIGVVGQLVKDQAFGAGGAALAMKVREESQQLRGDVSALAEELRSQVGLLGEEVLARQVAPPTPAAGSTLGTTLGTCALRMSEEGREEEQEGAPQLGNLRGDLAALSERVDSELAALPSRMAEASRKTAAEVISRASVQAALSSKQQQRPGDAGNENGESAASLGSTASLEQAAGGFHALLETLRRDQEADRAAHRSVLAFVEALLDRLAGLEALASGREPARGGGAAAAEESPKGRRRSDTSVASSPLGSPLGSPVAQVPRLPSVDEFLLQQS